MRTAIRVMVWGVGALSVWSSEGHAESIQRAALSLDGTLFSQTSVSVAAPAGFTGPSTEQSTTTWGFLTGGFGPGFGYGVTNNVLVGGQLFFSSSSTESGSSTSSTSAVGFYPRVEYVFAETEPVRPLLALIFGIADRTLKPGDDELSDGQHSVGAGLGLHAFVGNAISIDPLLSFHLLGGSLEVTQSRNGVPVSTTQDYSGTRIALSVSITGWLGAARARAESPPESPENPEGEAQRASVPLGRPVTAPPARSNDHGDAADAVAPIKLTQMLPGEHAIMLKGRPEASPKFVMVRVADPTSAEVLRDCRDIKLLAGTESFRIEGLTLRGRQQLGARERYLVDGSLPLRAIDAGVAAEDARLDVCGQTWPLTQAVRAAWAGFLVEFRRRGGAPGANEPPLTAEPPATQPTPSAPPHAVPVAPRPPGAPVPVAPTAPATPAK